MKASLFNENWKFWEVTNSFALNWAPPEDARVVTLPHDAMIENPQDPNAPAGANTGYRKGGVYSYSNTLTVTDPGKTYILKMEGAQSNAFVYVNGQLAAKRPYGYSVFYVLLNPYLSFVQPNEIRVQVRTGAEPNSRWYPGAGLYRDVYLLEGGSCYIKPDLVQIRTLKIPDAAAVSNVLADRSAEIEVSAMIGNRTNALPGSLDIRVEDASGKLVATALVPVDASPYFDRSANALAAQMTSFLSEEAAETNAACYHVRAKLAIPAAHLWSAEEPNLYTCKLTLKGMAGDVLDTHTDTFGIRTLSVSATQGFRVNGQEVKLRGACMHHDSGLLGAKTFEEVHIRQIQKLKEAGFNAIRSSHNPSAPALLRACDKVGMYVMDEAFDMWTRHKSDYDYGMYFEEWWEADIEAMVHNAFNHPSVIMYSIGNEIPEIGTPQGGRIAKALCDKIHSIDETRFTLASVNGMFSVGDALGQIVSDVAAELASQGKMDGNVNDFMTFMHAYMNDMTCHPIVDQVISVPFQYTDIAGYNYMGSRYDIEGELHPERVIVGSETGIGDICYNWDRVKKYPYLIGDFCWTGWEYLGEAGIGSPNYSNGSNPFGNAQFPLQISGTGCIDITGNRLPMSYYREIIFGLRKDPYIAVQDPAHYGEGLIHNPWIISDAIGSWSWDAFKGQKVVVEVYSAGDEVELLQNGTSLGRQPAGASADCMAFFETTYEPGTLTAISYEAGVENGRYSVTSAEGSKTLSISEEGIFSTSLPIIEHPETVTGQAAEGAAEGNPEAAAKEDIFADFTKYFEQKDPMANAAIDSEKLMAQYQASSIKSRELTEQLKASYLNGNASKPELILNIGESSLLQPKETDAADQNASGLENAVAEAVGSEMQSSASADDVAPVAAARPYHIRFLSIAITDENGILIPDQEEELQVSVEGDAEILAFGSADPYPAHNFNEGIARTWRGQAQLILKQYITEDPASTEDSATSESVFPTESGVPAASESAATAENGAPAASESTASVESKIKIIVTSDSGLRSSIELA